MRSLIVGTAIFAAATASVAVPESALAQSGYCPVAGRYFAIGRGPGTNASYQGEAMISAIASGCHVRWFPPNDSSGTGTYSNGVLTIYFAMAKTGAAGVVKYKRAPNGELHGVWWFNGQESVQGTETLRPR